ncbi:MAG: DUF6132 family protein [Melioribacteraceae bacterium]
MTIKKVLPVLGGAILGYAFYYFIGCRTGSCPLTGNPYISTLYGAAIGLVWLIPSKKKSEEGTK